MTASGMLQPSSSSFAERRSPRLVRWGVRVELVQGGQTWSGMTTGLNDRGLGARLRRTGGDPSPLAPRDLVAVRFQDPDIPSSPAWGRIERLESAWEAGFEFFAADAFTRSDPGLIRCIQRLIANQGPSLTPEKPVRRWFTHRRGATCGPMTTIEMRNALAQGLLDRTDLAWDYESNEWTPIGFFSAFDPGTPLEAAAGSRPGSLASAGAGRAFH